MLPNFLICGVAQGGTSFLAASLTQHPDVFMPVRSVPEPHFFLKSWEYKRGIESYQEEWFSEATQQKAIGEKSSSYIFGGTIVAKRILKCLSDVRLLVMLRDPTDRAWAHYRFSALNGIENLSFGEAVRREPERMAQQVGRWAEIQPFCYVGRGMYARQLGEFLKVFPRENLFVVKSETFRNDPATAFSEIFQFIGVDEDFVPQKVPSFKSLDVRDASLQYECREIFGDRLGVIVRAVRMNEDPSVYARSKTEAVVLERMVANLSYDEPEIDASTRTLLRDIFREDLEELQNMVSFPIDDWATFRAG